MDIDRDSESRMRKMDLGMKGWDVEEWADDEEVG